MVDYHYRWDFIGLSTDEKPTPENSEKVTDGSTFYCSDTSKLYVFCEGEWYEKVAQGGGGGTSNFNQLSNRPKYNGTEMTNATDIPEVPTVNDATLTITQNGTSKGTFTANDADDTTIALTDTTYSDFTGTDGSSAGTAGLVPAPATTDAGKFLKADGTWDTAGGSSVNVVQTTGTSTTDVMSQKAVTNMTFADSLRYKIRIGAGTDSSTADNIVSVGRNSQTTGTAAVALGYNSLATYPRSTALGQASKAQAENSLAAAGATVRVNSNASVAIGYAADIPSSKPGAIALGAYSSPSSTGEMNIGTSQTTYGYNSSNYRLLSGVYDGQNAHDAVTVGQVNATIDAINAALSTNIPHIGA